VDGKKDGGWIRKSPFPEPLLGYLIKSFGSPRTLCFLTTQTLFSLQYKTARSSELRSILAKARARIEQSNFDNGSSGGGGGGDGGRPNSSSSYGNGRNEVYSVPQKAGKSSESSSRNSSTPTNNQRSNERMNKSRYDEDSEPEEEPDISFGLTDESDTDSSDDNSNNKGTLGKMLKKKRGEILRK